MPETVKTWLVRKPISAIRSFLEIEAAGGIVLMVVAVLALIAANSPLAGAYDACCTCRSACASATWRSRRRCCTGSMTG